MKEEENQYSVPGLERGLAILEYLAGYPDGRTQGEIAEAVGCPTTSVFRMVLCLEKMGYVVRDPQTKTFRHTMKLLDLERQAISEVEILRAARPVMMELQSAVSDTVLIGVRDGMEIIVLDEVIGSRLLVFVSKLGYRIGAGYSAPGKAILAFLPEAEQKRIIGKLEFKQHTRNTIMTRAALRSQLDEIRTCGYAVDNEEHFEGIYCVGAPVFNGGGYPIASVWTTGLKNNIEFSQVPEIGKTVKRHAEKISRLMGYAGHSLGQKEKQ